MVTPVVAWALLAAGIVGAGLLLLILGVRLATTSEESQRLARYVAEPVEFMRAPQPDALAFRRSELQGSFRQRLLLPWFSRLGVVLNRMTPTRSIERLTRQLTIAGHPMGLGPREFYGLQLIFIVVGFWMAFSTLRQGIVRPVTPTVTGSALSAAQPAAARQLDLFRLAQALFGVYVGTQFPKIWLRGRVRARQKRIRRNLPDALDMLSVCAEAGLGFDQALQRVSESWKTPLAAEFGRVIQEMGMGLSRAQAMRNMADRLDVGELSSFTAVIVQSDEMGMSITDTLRSQAEQMRVERRHRAQEEARKAPLKMLFPMILLILPAMGAVVIGPTIPAFMEIFATIMNVAGQ
jgi:tight adherence protein C